MLQTNDRVRVVATHDPHYQQLATVVDDVQELEAEVGESVYRVRIGVREYCYEASALSLLPITKQLVQARTTAKVPGPYQRYANALVGIRQYRETLTAAAWSLRPRLVAKRMAALQRLRPVMQQPAPAGCCEGEW